MLKCLCKLGYVHSEVFFKIYNAKILPVLMYRPELWGYDEAHLCACKRLLNVGLQTPNSMVLGDLDRFPIFILTAVWGIKCWLRILHLPEERLTRKPTICYSFAIYMDVSCNAMDLCNGFGELWFQQGVGDASVFLRCFRQRLVA